MAVNDIENPEEGTPRSRKDIKRERRQMRSMNAQRAEVGAEPLYTKEEIREVGKPFKSEPSAPLSGTMEGIGSGKVEYNDPNKPAEPTYSYQKSGLTNKLGQRENIGPIDITKEQFTDITERTPNGQALANTLKNKAIKKDDLTLNQKQDLIKAANVAGEELEKTDEQINQQTKEEVNTVTGGDGKTAAGVMEKAPTQYDWTLSESREYIPTSPDDIYAQASQAKKKAPQLVIEKLGIQDYYPEIGRDIAVGNFSGSYAGSRTIFSGAGGLLPLGLYDARKRAIAAEVKRKEAIMDQIKEIPDIAKQFKTEFSQIYMNDFLAPWVNAYKDNPDGLMSNTDFLRDMAHYKSVAENFLKVDSDLREFEKLIQPGDKGTDKAGYGAYSTPAMLEILHKFKSGFLPGKTEDWLTGKKNISKLTETIQALPNGYKWADDKVKLLLEKGQAEIPIYPKDGVEWNSMTEKDKEQIKKDVNGLVVSLQDGSPDYETYLTSLKKYFHFDFETIADEWIKGNSLNALTPKEKEEYRKSLATYMLAQMPPDSIVNKVEMQANKAAERENSIRDYQAKMARIQADKEMFYADFNRHTSATRALYEGMQRLGSDSESIEIVDANVSDKNGDAMEWNVYNVDNGQYEWVKGSDIKAHAGRYFKSPADVSKKDGYFIPPSVVYTVPTSVHMEKKGNNYNVSTYGNSYESYIEYEGGVKEASAPIGVASRTPYATGVSGGKINDGVIVSSDNAIGSKFQRTAGNIYGGGAKEKVGGYNFQSTREPVNP